MKAYLFAPLAAIALSASAFALPAAAASGEEASSPRMEHMQHWAADHEALLDARLAGLKAGLKLTPDQDKLWGPFEGAVRDAAKVHMDHMQGMMEHMEKMRTMMRGQGMMDRSEMRGMGGDGEQMSPVDRLGAMADRMSQAAAALKQVAETAKPLYASLNDSQKRVFGFLGREMLMMGRGHGGMGMMRHGPGGMGDEGDSDDE